MNKNLSLLLTIITLSNAIDISDCINITVDNTDYVFIQNITSNQTCINISAENITINGANFYILGQDYSNYGIMIESGSRNISIQNINIGGYENGIGVVDSDNLTIASSSFTNLSKRGIEVSSSLGTGSNIIIRKNLIETIYGTPGLSTLEYGLFLSVGDNLTVENNTIRNTDYGIGIGGGSNGLVYQNYIYNSTIYNILYNQNTNITILNNAIDNENFLYGISYIGIYGESNNASIIGNNLTALDTGIQFPALGVGSTGTVNISRNVFGSIADDWISTDFVAGASAVYIYDNHFMQSVASGYYLDLDNTVVHLNVTKDCTVTNIIGGNCIGGNFYNVTLGGVFYPTYYTAYDTDNDSIGEASTRVPSLAIMYDYLPLTPSLAGYFTEYPTGTIDAVPTKVSYKLGFANVTSCLFTQEGINYTATNITNDTCVFDYSPLPYGSKSLIGYLQIADGTWFPTNGTESNPYSVCYLSCSTPSSGGTIIPPESEDTSDSTADDTSTSDNPFGTIASQASILGGGGTVPNDPVLADSIIKGNEDYLGLASSPTIEKKDTVSLALNEYQGLMGLYLKLPFFDLLNFGYVIIIAGVYFIAMALKNLERNQSLVNIGSMFSFAIFTGITFILMLVNEGLLLFATKVFGG